MFHAANVGIKNDTIVLNFSEHSQIQVKGKAWLYRKMPYICSLNDSAEANKHSPQHLKRGRNLLLERGNRFRLFIEFNKALKK
jgi:hypothetical protein